MILLDTDHLSILKYPASSKAISLTARLAASPDQQIGTTIISVEEQWRGWLAAVARTRDIQRQVKPYRELTSLLEFFGRWTVLPFVEAHAKQFQQIRGQGVRIGAMDLKIACIALANNALLLSANASDFKRVPGLQVENWLD